jgi:hypothetical protein
MDLVPAEGDFRPNTVLITVCETHMVYISCNNTVI